MDYSKWRGTWREHERERLILDDLEREILVSNLTRLPTVRSQRDLDVITTARNIEIPWMSGEATQQNIMDGLDNLLLDDAEHK